MFPFAENLSKCIRKPLISARQTSSFLRKPFFSVLKRHPILKTKSFPFEQPLPHYHSKPPFSALHLPFAPSHNLLSTKNPAILLQSALNPCAVTPESRTDSKPFRRRFVRKTGFGSCRWKLLQKYFRQSFESSPESRGSQTSGVLPVLFVQAKRIKSFPFGKFEVLQTSNQLTQTTTSH